MYATTHVDIEHATAKHVNSLLNTKVDPVRRDEIINLGIKIADDVNDQMDKLLNPGSFGSVEDEKALAEWVSTKSSNN